MQTVKAAVISQCHSELNHLLSNLSHKQGCTGRYDYVPAVNVGENQAFFFRRRRKREIEREGMRRIEGRLVWRLGSSQPLSPSITVRRFVRADWDTKMCVSGVLLEEDLCVYCALHLCLEFWIRCKNNLTICKSLLLGLVRNSRRGGCEGRLFIAWCLNKQPKTVKHKHRTKKHSAYKARLWLTLKYTNTTTKILTMRCWKTGNGIKSWC